MYSVVENLVDELKSKYSGAVPFKDICKDEGIIITKARLDEGLKGFYISANSHKIIVLNQGLSFWERRDWAYHELWHHFASPNTVSFASIHNNRKEESKANLFAALCRIPNVRNDDTIDSLCDRHNVSPILAKLRIEHELKKLER